MDKKKKEWKASTFSIDIPVDDKFREYCRTNKINASGLVQKFMLDTLKNNKNGK